LDLSCFSKDDFLRRISLLKLLNLLDLLCEVGLNGIDWLVFQNQDNVLIAANHLIHPGF
jgi:hypothetical protein